MSTDPQETSKLACPESFPPDAWESLGDSDRRRIVEYEKAIAESKSPSWWETRVTVVLSLDEDAVFIGKTLEDAGVPHNWAAAHGMAWIEVPANEREKALLSLQSEPRLEGRFVNLMRCSDQPYYEVNQIPR